MRLIKPYIPVFEDEPLKTYLPYEHDSLATLRSYLPLVGRVLVSAIFLISGIDKLFHWQETTVFMESKGIPLAPVALAIAATLEIAGGLSILFAWKIKWAATALLIYLIPTSLIFHNFWSVSGPEYVNQLTHFLKNLTIIGALLVVAAIPERDLKVRRLDSGLEISPLNKEAA